MESDPEVKLEDGHHMTTFFRQYDPRVARWWSNDPVTHEWQSPYMAMEGNSVRFSDPLGADGEDETSSPLEPVPAKQEDTGPDRESEPLTTERRRIEYNPSLIGAFYVNAVDKETRDDIAIIVGSAVAIAAGGYGFTAIPALATLGTTGGAAASSFVAFQSTGAVVSGTAYLAVEIDEGVSGEPSSIDKKYLTRSPVALVAERAVLWYSGDPQIAQRTGNGVQVVESLAAFGISNIQPSTTIPSTIPTTVTITNQAPAVLNDLTNVYSVYQLFDQTNNFLESFQPYSPEVSAGFAFAIGLSKSTGNAVVEDGEGGGGTQAESSETRNRRRARTPPSNQGGGGSGESPANNTMFAPW